MAEDGTTDVATTEVATQPIPALVNAEGELRENWRESLPEDIRGDKVFERVSNFEGIMKTLSSSERAYGKDKIAIPNEASSEAEWDSFYTAGGRPKAATEYDLSRPEELPEEHYNQELATAAQELFHKIGLSQSQADALFEFNNNNVMSQLTKNSQDAEAMTAELTNGLYADWGNAYEQKKHLGNVAVERGTDGNEEFKERIAQKFGNDPDFIRFAANLGGKFAEAGSVNVEMIPTPGDIQTQIDEAMSHKSHGADYVKHGFTRTQHDAQVEKVRLLFVEKTKHIKTG